MADNIWTPWLKSGKTGPGGPPGSSGGVVPGGGQYGPGGTQGGGRPCPLGMQDICLNFAEGDDGICTGYTPPGSGMGCANQDLGDGESGDGDEPSQGGEDSPDTEPHNEDGSSYSPDQNPETKEREAMREGIRGDDSDLEDRPDQKPGGDKKKENPAEKAKKTAETLGLLAQLWPGILGCAGILLVIVAVVVIGFIIMPDPAAGTTMGTPTVICIDPGHPSEVGAGTSSPSSKTSEISMNWLVAKDLEAALVAKGYQVKLTKDTETETVTNKERVARCVAAGAAFDYRIHMDSPGSSLGGGPWHEVPGPTYTNVHDTSKKYADAIQQSIATKLGLKTSGTQPINGGVRNDTKALVGSIAANASSLPVALIEMMTMDEANVIWLKNPTNRGTLVAAIADGIQSVIPTTSGGSGAAQIVAIAEQELKGGAYEIPYGANCGDGVDKYTTGDCQAWCADFVSWVVNAAGKPFTGGTSGGWRLPAVDQVHAWFKANGIFIPIGTAPQPGDIAIHNTSSQSHVNIVISVSGDTMSVIGGNQSNTVTKRTESWKDASGWGLVGFGRFK